DYSTKEMLRIYKKRLIMFFVIIVGNLVLLVYLVGLSKHPTVFSFISISAVTIILSLFLFRVRGREKLRAENQVSVILFLEEVKKWLGEITEITLLLIAIGITVEILFGNVVPFLGEFVDYLIALLNIKGENWLASLIALSIFACLFYKVRAHQ
ncbi:MAG: hypothetical protein ACYSRZ_01075, partial [Planctomycetota bacterium]